MTREVAGVGGVLCSVYGTVLDNGFSGVGCLRIVRLEGSGCL